MTTIPLTPTQAAAFAALLPAKTPRCILCGDRLYASVPPLAQCARPGCPARGQRTANVSFRRHTLAIILPLSEVGVRCGGEWCNCAFGDGRPVCDRCSGHGYLPPLVGECVVEWPAPPMCRPACDVDGCLVICAREDPAQRKAPARILSSRSCRVVEVTSREWGAGGGWNMGHPDRWNAAHPGHPWPDAPVWVGEMGVTG